MTDEELKQRAREFVEKNWEDVVASTPTTATAT